MPQTLRRNAPVRGSQPGAADAGPQRASLAERIERAHEAREQAASRAASSEERERMRREPFKASPLVRRHEDELLAITGELARVLPTRAEYCARTGKNVGWVGGPTGDLASLKPHALIENPACAFVWEVKHNPRGMLGASANREYNWALATTSNLSDLWEDNPAASELDLAKALIVQVVLGDDELRAEVLERAGKLARTAAGTLGPYFADWKR